MRPRSPPWVPTCMEVPQTMSSTSPVSSPLRSARARRTVAPRTWGCSSASAPLPTLPIPRGVRQASMIQASVTSYPRSSLHDCCRPDAADGANGDRKSIPNNGAERVGPAFRPDGRTTWPRDVQGDAGCGAGRHAGLRPGDARVRGDRVQRRGDGDLVRAAGRAGRGRSLGRDARAPRRRSGPGSWCDGRRTRYGSAARSSWSGTTCRPASTPRPTGGSSTATCAAQGHAWVGVSAQKVGIDGGGFVESIHLKLLAPERYGELEHPGDAWSFDIFTQVGALAPAARRTRTRWAAWWPSTCSRRASRSPPPAW